jgi:hypothetical protein
MQAGHQADTLEGLFLLETFGDVLEHRHILPGPLHPQFALVRQIEIFDIVTPWQGYGIGSYSRCFLHFLPRRTKLLPMAERAGLNTGFFL